MIVMIVTIVLAAIAIVAFMMTKPNPVQPPAPEAVVTSKPQLPTGDVQYSTALPNAGSAATPGTGGGSRGRTAGGQQDAPGMNAPIVAGVSGG